MDKDKSSFGLDPGKLAQILNRVTDTDQLEYEEQNEQSRANLLQDRLFDKIPLDPAVIESLPVVLKELYQELLPWAGETLDNLLQNPKTDLSIILNIKDYSKQMVMTAESEVENDTATAIYYAAIANALVFHDEKISKFSYEELKQSLNTFINYDWIPKNLVQLFCKASQLCSELE